MNRPDDGALTAWSTKPWMIRCALASTALALLAAATLLFAARRASGALVEPLPPEAYVPIGIVLAVLVFGLRQAIGPELPWFSPARRFWHWLPVLLATALAAAISVPGSPLGGLLLLWLPLVAVEVAYWLIAGRRSAIRDNPASTAMPDEPATLGDDEALHELLEDVEEPEPELPPDDVVQQLVRRQDELAGDSLSGSVRTRFGAGQRTATAHLAFCPPFAATPEFTAETWDGPAATVKVAQLLPYGARLELRLDRELDSGASVLVAFEARVPRANGA